VQAFSEENIKKFSAASLITRSTNDVTQIQNFAQQLLRGAFRSPIMLVGAFVMSMIMDFRLAAEQKMIPAERIAFHDQTSAGVTFNLRNAEVGVYDVVSELPNGTQATLPQGFHVIPGVQSKLGIKIDAPRVVHSGSHSPVSVAFANGGTNDIQIKEILIKSRGSYLGKTVADFKNASSELHLVPEGYEADRFGYISIAPGTQKVINFFMEQNAGTSYMTVYIVK